MKKILLSLSLAVVWLGAGAAVGIEAGKAPGACTEVQTCGGPQQCAHCGRNCCCEKHCQVVCEMKEVKKTVWVVKCEEFCAPLPRCGHCGKDCEGCERCEACGSNCESKCGGRLGKNCDPCAAENAKHYVTPKCGKVRTKKTLMKKEVVCKVPSYKCVVVYTCPGCACKVNEGQQAVPAPAKKTSPVPPPPPLPDAPSKTTERAPLPPSIG